MSDKQNNLPENPEVTPRGFSMKKNIMIIVIAAVLALGVSGTAVTIGVSSIPANRVSRYMGAAERYLSEMNYEQAIIEFQRILEIEPMNVNAYLGLAEAYLGLGDTKKTLETLCKGLEMTADSRLQAKIDELSKLDVSLEVSSTTSSEESVESEPVESEASVVTNGYVTILGKEYDIATTEKLLVYSKEFGETANWDDREKDFDGVVCYPGYGLSNEDWEKIAQLTQLRTLEIAYVTPDKIFLTGLTGLTNLRNLTLWDSSINDEDLMQIGKLTNLVYLNLNTNYIRDITPLSNLTNLTFLNLEGNHISDITPLANLSNLTDLYLGYNNQISDLTPLEGLTNLISLSVYTNKISDITPLAGLTNLKELILQNNHISDITPLVELTNLTDLDLSDNYISDISSLARLTDLKTLNLGFNRQLSNLTPLEELTNLVELCLLTISNDIIDITPLTGLTNLTYLDIGNNDIDQIGLLFDRLPNCTIII